MYYSKLDTPIGQLLLAGDGVSLQFLGFPKGKGRVDPESDWIEKQCCFSDARQQLIAYFKGELKRFDLDLTPSGTDFQLRVLQQLQAIPYGETRSYAEIAEAIGSPAAVRAVGAANGRNPLPIVIPCHRVIGSDGSLTGFGGGLETKQYLLHLESDQQLELY